MCLKEIKAKWPLFVPLLCAAHFFVLYVAGWPATTQSWCSVEVWLCGCVAVVGWDMCIIQLFEVLFYFFVAQRFFARLCLCVPCAVCVCVVSWLSLLPKPIQAHSSHGYCCIMFLLYVCLPSAFNSTNTHTDTHTSTSALAVDFLCIISTNDWCYSPYGWSTHKHPHTHTE